MKNSLQNKLLRIVLSLYFGIMCVAIFRLWYIKTSWDDENNLLLMIPICMVALCDSIAVFHKKFKIISLAISAVSCFFLCKYLDEITTDSVWYIIVDVICIGIICGIVVSQLGKIQEVVWASVWLLYPFLFIKFAYLYLETGTNTAFDVFFLVIAAGLAVLLIVVIQQISTKTNAEENYLLKRNPHKLGTSTGELIALCQKCLSEIPNADSDMQVGLQVFINRFAAMRGTFNNYYERGFVIDTIDTCYVKKMRTCLENYNHAMQNGKNAGRAEKQLSQVLSEVTSKIESVIGKTEEHSMQTTERVQ